MVHFDYRSLCPKIFRQIGVNDHVFWITKLYQKWFTGFFLKAFKLSYFLT